MKKSRPPAISDWKLPLQVIFGPSSVGTLGIVSLSAKQMGSDTSELYAGLSSSALALRDLGYLESKTEKSREREGGRLRGRKKEGKRNMCRNCVSYESPDSTDPGLLKSPEVQCPIHDIRGRHHHQKKRVAVDRAGKKFSRVPYDKDEKTSRFR